MKRPTQLQKVLITIVLLFVVPVLVIGLLFSSFLLRCYKRNQMESCEKSVQTVMNLAQDKFSAINDLATQLQYDETVQAGKKEIYPLRMLEAQNRLRAYELVNGQLEEIVFLYRRSGSIVSSKTTYTEKTFLDLMPLCRTISQEGFYQQCLYGETVEWYPAVTSGNTQMLLGIYPLPIEIGGKYATVLFCMESQELLESLFASFPYEDSVLHIENAGGELLVANSELLFDEPAVDSEEFAFIQTENRGIYAAFSSPVNMGQLVVRVYVPQEQIFYSYRQILETLSVIIVTLILAGLLAIWRIADVFRHASISLRRAIQGIHKGPVQTDEIVAAIQSIEYLKEISSSLQKNLDNSQQIIDELEKYQLAIREKLSADEGISNPLEQAIRYAMEHYAEYDFSVTMMAQASGLSGSALSERFKKEMHTSPSQYITELRIGLAKELLISSSLPISEIVGRIGYIDTSAFIRKFKQQTGVTPGQFRQWYHTDNGVKTLQVPPCYPKSP